MFIDASAAIAILSGEEDGAVLAGKLEGAEKCFISPLAIYETVAGLARKRACPIEEAEALVNAFVGEVGAELVDISEPVGRLAIEAFARYGKGRHRADLNLGDCFAYAVARFHGVPLLFKGNDFVHTDAVLA